MPTGPSTTTSPYLIGSSGNVQTTSILTAGDALPGGGVFAGFADGLTAFDNGDGTITVLVVHMLSGLAGIVRDHGAMGSYIDRLVIDKATLQVTYADDLIKSVARWNDSQDVHTFTNGSKLAKFTVSDLGATTAYFNSETGLGTDVRILLNGEENGSGGRVFATVLSGSGAGTAWELPFLGNMNFQTVVSNPHEQDQTILAITDDSSGGQVYFYVGDKQATGTDLAKAGLMNGQMYGLKVSGLINEVAGAAAAGTFTLQEIGPNGNVSNLTGAQIESESDAEGVTGFFNPEDAVWDPAHPNVLYFATTGSNSTNSRLYKATFNDIEHPELGGTIEALLVGTEGQRKLDSVEISGGKLILQEDPGNSSRLATVWEYDIATDKLVQLAAYDPARFTMGQPGYITQDEEASGILDVTDLLGDGNTRAYLLTAQVHKPTNDPATVQMGQLLLMRVDETTSVEFTSGSDTYLRQARPTTAYGTALTVSNDGDAGLLFQGLLQFSGLFGDQPGQVPIGATITGATLKLNTVDSTNTGTSIYRMTADWNGQATWGSMGNGIQVGVETAASPDLTVAAASSGVQTFDVTASVKAWLSGAASSAQANQANKGWAFIANGTDDWGFASFEGAVKPVLTVSYTLPESGSASSLAAPFSAASSAAPELAPASQDAHHSSAIEYRDVYANWLQAGFANPHNWDLFHV